MENMHHLTVRTNNEKFYEFDVLIDGKPHKTRSLDLHLDTENYPETAIKFIVDPEFDVNTLLTVDINPQSIESAVNILKAALMKNDFIAFMGMNDLLAVMEAKNGQ